MKQFILDGDVVKRLLYNKPVINGNDPVDPTTCEAYKLYVKNELLYERDKTFQSVYCDHNLVEEKYDAAGYYYNDFKTTDYQQYNKLTLPVTSDFVTMLQNQSNFRFGITQYDFGRNKFWETIITEINKLVITNRAFTRFLFRNALGLAGLDWNRIGDETLHGLLFDIDVTYPELGQAFTNCDIPNVTINCRKFTQTLGKAFFNTKAHKVKIIGNGLQVWDIQGLFEWAAQMERLEELTVYNINTNIDQGSVKYPYGWRLTYGCVRMTWAFEGCSATYVKLLERNGNDISVRPDSCQIFTGNCGVEVVDGAAWDFKLMYPDDFTDISPSYGHPVFGRAPIRSMKIKGLNKGDWTIPMPLDDTSVIYLLNNVYDLTSNANNIVENNSNSFNGWTRTNVNINEINKVTFKTGQFSEVVKGNWNGGKIFKLKSSITTQFTLTLKNQGTTVLSQYFNIGTSETIIDRSANTFDEVHISKNMENESNAIVLEFTEICDSAASNVLAATITFEQVQYKADFDTAIAAAQAKGWTVNFAS